MLRPFWRIFKAEYEKESFEFEGKTTEKNDI